MTPHYSQILSERYPTDEQLAHERVEAAREVVARAVANHKARHAANHREGRPNAPSAPKQRKPRAKETKPRRPEKHWAYLLLQYVRREDELPKGEA